MRIIFAGTPEVALPALSELMASEHEVIAVLTQPPSRSGRGRNLSPSPIHDYATTHGITVLTPEKVVDAAAAISNLAPDCVAVVAYGQLIPARMLSIPPRGWVNLHFSLLPQYRGAAPVQHSIWRGEQITGATTFLLDEGMDSGPILGHVTEVIRASDTSGDLLQRLADSGSHLLRQSLDALESGRIVPVAQSGDDISYAPKITREDARIEWNLPAIAIDRQIRAMTPQPGAWTTWINVKQEIERISVNPVLLFPREEDVQVVLSPGELLVKKNRILVGTATTPVSLTGVTPQGKKLMNAPDWIRGLSMKPRAFA